jgi:hypothetical protein
MIPSVFPSPPSSFLFLHVVVLLDFYTTQCIHVEGGCAPQQQAHLGTEDGEGLTLWLITPLSLRSQMGLLTIH